MAERVDTTDQEMVKQYEETALLGMKAVREYLIYQGDNSKFLHRAKVGAMAMGAYTRLRATRANESALRLASERQINHKEMLREAMREATVEPKALPKAV